MGLPRISPLRQTYFSLLFQPVTLAAFRFREKDAQKQKFSLFSQDFSLKKITMLDKKGKADIIIHVRV